MNKNENLLKTSKIYKNYLSDTDIQKGIFFIENRFIELLYEYFHVYQVREPYFSKRDIYTIDIPKRKISFDTIVNNNIYSLYNDFDSWIITKGNKEEIEMNQGIFIKTKFVNRDIDDLNNESFEKNVLIINFRINDSLENNELFIYINNHAKKIYQIIYQIYKEIIFSFDELKENTFPKELIVKTIINKIQKSNFALNDELNLHGAILLHDIKEESIKLFLYNQITKQALMIINFKIVNNNLLINIDLDSLIIILLKKNNVLEIQSNLF